MIQKHKRYEFLRHCGRLSYFIRELQEDCPQAKLVVHGSRLELWDADDEDPGGWCVESGEIYSLERIGEHDTSDF